MLTDKAVRNSISVFVICKQYQCTKRQHVRIWSSYLLVEEIDQVNKSQMVQDKTKQA